MFLHFALFYEKNYFQGLRKYGNWYTIVTAMAILLNHDYDYTRTTQVIHSNDTKSLCAENLPRLAQNQDIVTDEGQNLKPNKSEDL